MIRINSLFDLFPTVSITLGTNTCEIPILSIKTSHSCNICPRRIILNDKLAGGTKMLAGSNLICKCHCGNNGWICRMRFFKKRVAHNFWYCYQQYYSNCKQVNCFLTIWIQANHYFILEGYNCQYIINFSNSGSTIV